MSLTSIGFSAGAGADKTAMAIMLSREVRLVALTPQEMKNDVAIVMAAE